MMDALCSEFDNDSPKTCQRIMISKDWPVHRKWKCGRDATHKQDDGLPLCERHYNKWKKKLEKTQSSKGHILDVGRSCFDNIYQ
ncbi:hypothetical protein LCGC14_2994520 [marine sediment metagenome]|uniref:Uncharacterized protein n=1 Tax=marine sediment metagenome TaxID=412755 RepID=A0A0F8ZU04_9ZZZZ